MQRLTNRCDSGGLPGRLTHGLVMQLVETILAEPDWVTASLQN